MSQVKMISVSKKLMIESQSSNGKCYLRLLTLLPNFLTCEGKYLEEAIIVMFAALEKNPRGIDVLPFFWICNKIMSGTWNYDPKKNEDEIQQVNNSEFMQTLFDSQMRYSWEEIGGVQHISWYVNTGVNDPAVWNEMGYSARYVLCMLINPGSRIGSEMNFSGLFDRIRDEAINEYNEKQDQGFYDSGLASENEELRSNLDDRHREIEMLNIQMRDLQKKLSATSNHRRSPQLDKETIDNFANLLKTQKKLGCIAEEDSTEPLTPNDSSSVSSRYNRKFMPHGTVLNTSIKEDDSGDDVASTITIQPLEKAQKNVVVGYQKTKSMMVRENKVYQRIGAINGLANPFHSHRLNFLCHLETAMKSVQVRKDHYSQFDILLWISKHKSQTPSQELLYQVISYTFDFEELIVIANPYKLPFLEVGMKITDNMLAKCFNLIRLEFKTLWFEKMKSLIVPDFHNEFLKYKEDELTTSSQKSKHVEFVKEDRKQGNGRGSSVKRNGSSVFSILR
ncbi:nonstructural protein [Rice dwarf-associated bunya-like virus]|uniref:Nonstructural protein n=1 Tax=Rice dwarf-associated bunya-like virus TaxID=2963305 RepID=A0AAE9MRE6_9VIRU|nr:nonstructural protein [Rice dwarf-associated bunya-like virus]